MISPTIRSTARRSSRSGCRSIGSIARPASSTSRARIAGARWFQPKFFRRGGVDLEVQDSRFEPLPDLDAERGRHEFLAWDMEPGDVIAFHALTLHGASGNLSATRRRRAWATRWCGDDARYARRVGQISPPIEGHGLKPGDRLACEMFPKVWPE